MIPVTPVYGLKSELIHLTLRLRAYSYVYIKERPCHWYQYIVRQLANHPSPGLTINPLLISQIDRNYA